MSDYGLAGLFLGTRGIPWRNPHTRNRVAGALARQSLYLDTEVQLVGY